jgi:hypothetical protein
MFIICPKCYSHRIRRVAREGFLYVKLAPFFGRYPWRCSACGEVCLLKERGEVKRSRRAGNKYEELPDQAAEEAQRRAAELRRQAEELQRHAEELQRLAAEALEQQTRVPAS